MSLTGRSSPLTVLRCVSRLHRGGGKQRLPRRQPGKEPVARTGRVSLQQSVQTPGPWASPPTDDPKFASKPTRHLECRCPYQRSRIWTPQRTIADPCGLLAGPGLARCQFERVSRLYQHGGRRDGQHDAKPGGRILRLSPRRTNTGPLSPCCFGRCQRVGTSRFSSSVSSARQSIVLRPPAVGGPSSSGIANRQVTRRSFVDPDRESGCVSNNRVAAPTPNPAFVRTRVAIIQRSASRKNSSRPSRDHSGRVPRSSRLASVRCSRRDTAARTLRLAPTRLTDTQSTGRRAKGRVLFVERCPDQRLRRVCSVHRQHAHVYFVFGSSSAYSSSRPSGENASAYCTFGLVSRRSGPLVPFTGCQNRFTVPAWSGPNTTR